jgi:hypothetical protein
MARFDWYQATVPAPVPDVLAALPSLADSPAWERMRKAPHGYGFGQTLNDSQGPVLRVWWGGSHEHPHVVASGERTPAVADLLRGEWPQHRVSRVDVCEDYSEPGAYDRLQGIALGVAQEHGVTVGTAGDHLLTKQGRTLYLGAPTSHTRLRVYDKAAELRSKFQAQPERLAELPDELARFEVQVRPQHTLAKIAAAQADPVSLMGSSAWMRKLMQLVAGLDLEPFQAGKVWRQSDDDRAYAALLAQYGGVLRRVCADLGSWDCVGRQIGEDLERRSHAKN